MTRAWVPSVGELVRWPRGPEAPRRWRVEAVTDDESIRCDIARVAEPGDEGLIETPVTVALSELEPA